MYIAVDSNGTVCLYDNKPTRHLNTHNMKMEKGSSEIVVSQNQTHNISGGLWNTEEGEHYVELPLWTAKKLNLSWDNEPLEINIDNSKQD